MNKLLLLKPALLLMMLSMAACHLKNTTTPTMPVATFDWQGHRGARGLMPENTIPAFLKALEYPKITTLELDLAVSKDSQLVVSHEPWMSHEICRKPGGGDVTQAEEATFNILGMTYAEIESFDCGSRGHSRFPEQQKTPAAKPTLPQVIEAVERYCAERKRPLPNYNIEIKSQPGWDNHKTPPPAVFARLVVEEIRRLGIADRTCVQSFDKRTLREVHQLDSLLTTALLVENLLGLEANVEELGYVPPIYSPYHKLVTAQTVRNAHAKGMRLIPWTVNETADMLALIKLGVDGIITDYPDRIP